MKQNLPPSHPHPYPQPQQHAYPNYPYPNPQQQQQQQQQQQYPPQNYAYYQQYPAQNPAYYQQQQQYVAQNPAYQKPLVTPQQHSQQHPQQYAAQNPAYQKPLVSAQQHPQQHPQQYLPQNPVYYQQQYPPQNGAQYYYIYPQPQYGHHQQQYGVPQYTAQPQPQPQQYHGQPGAQILQQPIMKEEQEIIVKCSLQEMVKRFFNDYVIVWYDPGVNSEENKKYIAQLERFCQVKTFTEYEKAVTCLKETKATCHVITAGTNGELFVKEISSSENVLQIYVFCQNKELHSTWAKDYTKISCIETQIQNVLNQIQHNLLKWYKQASSLKVTLPAFAPIFNDSDKSEINNLHRYLKVIPNFKNRAQAKQDLLTLSKEIYSDEKNMGFIVSFEKFYHHYNKEEILRWYTQESFVYKITNNCLRIASPDSIQYCRLLLRDIERAIREQYQQKSKHFNGLLYRATYLSADEWSSLTLSLWRFQEKNRENDFYFFVQYFFIQQKIFSQFNFYSPTVLQISPKTFFCSFITNIKILIEFDYLIDKQTTLHCGPFQIQNSPIFQKLSKFVASHIPLYGTYQKERMKKQSW